MSSATSSSALIAGVAAFVCLVALGVPSPVVLALFVAVADLIPLVGATLGAAVCVIAAYLHTPTAGIISLIFFIVYQQMENGVLYPWIMARKVNVNPLGILLSVLIAVEVFGVLGALLGGAGLGSVAGGHQRRSSGATTRAPGVTRQLCRRDRLRPPRRHAVALVDARTVRSVGRIVEKSSRAVD